LPHRPRRIFNQNGQDEAIIFSKDEAYPGDHETIIDSVLCDQVQSCLADNAVERGTGTRVKNSSLLVGLLFDREGHRMTPTHAIKNGRRYRYYVSRPLIVEARADVTGLRIPAAEIEQVVINRIRQLLSEPASVYAIIEAEATGPQRQQTLMARAAELARAWDRMSPLRMRAILLALIPADRGGRRPGDHSPSAAPSRCVTRRSSRPSKPEHGR
jgi:hypothetical protein